MQTLLLPTGIHPEAYGRGDDGLPGSLDFNAVFEGIPFPVKPISFPKWRGESIKASGNAIVPQVAFRIFRTIMQCTIQLKTAK